MSQAVSCPTTGAKISSEAENPPESVEMSLGEAGKSEMTGCLSLQVFVTGCLADFVVSEALSHAASDVR